MESGSIKVSGCSLEAGANIMGEAGGQLLQLGVAMHRRGAEETMRRVEVKLLAAKGLAGSLKVLSSPRTGYGGQSLYESRSPRSSSSATATTICFYA